MITEISLDNFKSWRKISRMRLAPITGLFGTNSSGKTSILQWLLMLKQTVDSSDRSQALNLGDSRSLVEFGSFADVVHDHELPGRIVWELRWSLDHTRRIVDLEQGPDAVVIEDDKVAYRCTVGGEESGEVRVERMAYDFGGSTFGYNHDGLPGDYSLWAQGPMAAGLKRTEQHRWDLPAPVKCYGFPYQVNLYFQKAGFLLDLGLRVEELFGRLFYLGPLRAVPARYYTWAGGKPDDVGPHGERVIDALLASRHNGHRIHDRATGVERSVEESVAYWLQELGLIHDFAVQDIAGGSGLYRVRVRRAAESPEVLITDVGFGVSQLLPVLVLCYYVPEGSTVLLEQPEAHLHPRVQAALADVLVEVTKSRNLQLIVESHSEHLLRRMQRRIAEESLSSGDVALYFCRLADGISQLDPLEVDAFGNISNWPDDFFGDQFGEMAAMAEAVAERRQQEAG